MRGLWKLVLFLVALGLFAASVLAACAPAAAPTPTKALTAEPTRAPTTAPTKAPAAEPTKPPAPTPTPAPAAAPQAARPKQLDKVSLRLDWLPFGYQAPFYLAQDKGWYADNGLEVTINSGQGSMAGIRLIGTRQDETFAFADGAVMAVGAAEGIPVKMLALTSRQNLSAVMFPDDAPIKTPKDLEGKSIAFTPGSSGEQLFPALLSANKVDPDKVKIVNVEAASKNTTMMQKKTDATIATVVSNFRLEQQSQGAKFRTMGYTQFGLDIAGFGLLTHNDTIKNNPDMVRRFVAASIKGWEAAQANPREAIDVMKKVLPDQTKSLEADTLFKELTGFLNMADSRNTKGKPIGWQSKEDWQSTVEILAKNGVIKTPPSADAIFTNDFLPK